MEATYVIKRPLLSEKNTWAAEQNRYAFEVDIRACKDEIKLAIEAIYKVRVTGVNTQIRKGKHRRLKYGEVQDPTIKRAIIRLHAQDVIELF